MFSCSSSAARGVTGCREEILCHAVKGILMSFAQRSKDETHQKTSKCLEEDVRPMLLHWANVRRV